MDSSPVLGQQSQNKMHSDHKRMKNELNTMPANSAASKQRPVLHHNKKDMENQDPEGSKNQKAPVRPGLSSRLPVLAKSLHLQVPSDFTESHKRWEENSPARKSKRSKPCTKPVPFNFSDPRTTKKPIHKKPQTVATTTQASVTQLKKTCTVNSKTKDMNDKPASASSKTQGAKAHLSTVQHSARKDNPAALLPNDRDSSPEEEKPQGYRLSSAVSSVSHAPTRITKIVNNTLHASCPGQSGTFSRTPLGLSNPSLSIPKSVSALAEPTAGTEACLNNFGLLSLKDPSKTPGLHTGQTVHSGSGVNSSSNTAGIVETLHQSGHAALLRFLQNEGNNVMASTTPQSTKPYNYQPLRVSVLKGRKNAGPTTGPTNSVQFSPDPAALQSILQNEGVTAGGPTSGRGTSVYSARRVPVSQKKKSRKDTIGGAMGPTNSVQFSPDPAALQSILQNEGVTAGGPTPGRGTSVYSARRVPVSKSRKETIGGAMGPTNSVQFSPDPAALQSILQNEGVKAGGPTPGRGTSVYSARRVPVSKSRKETIGGAVESSLRVADTRHRPLSSIHRKFLSESRVHYAGSPLLEGTQNYAGYPLLKGPQSDKGQSHKEDVVQKLFIDEEEDCPPCTEVTDGGAETKAEQLSDQHSDPLLFQIKSHPEQKGEISNYHGEQESQSRAGGQPFLQAPERASVIFWSTGKNLMRTPHVEKLETSALRDKHNTVVQKSGAPGCAVALLRKRMHLLEEERLDDEVATYTSHTAPDSASALPPPAFQPPRPRCQNPLASVLHFQESTRFVPIDP